MAKGIEEGKKHDRRPVRNTHASPFSWFTASRPLPMLTKSRRTKLGARPAAKPVHPLAFFTMLETNPGEGTIHNEETPQQCDTYEATLFVVGASSGSLMMMPSPSKSLLSE